MPEKVTVGLPKPWTDFADLRSIRVELEVGATQYIPSLPRNKFILFAAIMIQACSID
jgi:hypothetical protein